MNVSEISSNVALVEDRVAAACRRGGRSRESVTLIAVSKTFPPEAIEAAMAAGIVDIGENRIQEMSAKIDLLSNRPRLHLIGNLQSNKVKPAVSMFDVIHTVDSLGLTEKIARQAEGLGKTVEVLIEINLGGEAQKGGVLHGDTEQLAVAASQIPSITLSGLMAIPPVGTVDQARRHFQILRQLRDRLAPNLPASFRHLSMGMSADFELAIEEGATMVRVGRAIFGARG